MIGIYFSGTGNNKYCLETFVSLYDAAAETVSLEENNVIEKIILHKDIVFAYPIYYSNLPKIVRDFINNHHSIWEKKNIFIIATMGLFGQRLWFPGKTLQYYENVHIDTAACIGCGSCVATCPMQNLSLIQEKATAGKKCTLCYRCANQCTRKAITILGKQVISQWTIHSLEDIHTNIQK